ncbi:MAG: hypothetical protein LUD68_00475 [Rikenellaceae bacterium]|nr:hypothetical protein [Rikenellaceae bacterium]
MKKLRLLFGFLAVILLAGVMLYSCQSDGSESYHFEEEELTAADLFVASENYQSFSAEIRKDMRKLTQTLELFTDAQYNAFFHLNEMAANSSDRSETEVIMKQISDMVGFDYQERNVRLATLTCETFSGQEFSQMELIKARQNII